MSDSTTLPDLDNSELEVTNSPLPDPASHGVNPPAGSINPDHSSSSLITPKLKKLLLIIVGLLTSLIVVGVIYKSTRPAATPSSSSSSTPAPTAPSPSPATTTDQLKPLRVGGITLTYPADWLLVFSPYLDPDSPATRLAYFARSTNEYREIASCASTGSCTAAPLTLKISQVQSIWESTPFLQFLGQINPELDLNSLVKSEWQGHPVYFHYLDRDKLYYQAYLLLSDTTYQAIYLSSTEETRSMLDYFVNNLADFTQLDPSVSLSSDNSRAFIAKISARLETNDYNILMQIIKNVLAPSDNSLNPTYELTTEGSSAYPPGNLLDYTYYLLTNNPDLNPGEYVFPQLTITLSEPPQENMPKYLSDSKYCEQDSDCVYRSDFCTIDSYNRYHLFKTPWGCGMPDYAGLGNYGEIEASLECAYNEEADVDYDALSCTNNQCTVSGLTPICVEKEF